WGRVCDLGEDGEIKGPGPDWSKALMVLKNFRDRVHRQGPGFSTFLNVFRSLSGTSRFDGPNV
uniref:hypothetical protein n=1 Tax=uncultured Caulobacter sp. TaxID=158749 RepID=UPI0025EC9A98